MTIVQSVGSFNTSNSTSATSASITPTTIGNSLIVAVGWANAGGTINSIVDSLGTPLVAISGVKNQNGSCSQLFAYKITSLTARTINVTFSASVISDIIIAEYPFTFQQGYAYGASNGSQGSTVVSVPSYSVPAGNLAICCVYDETHQSTFTFSGGTGTFTVQRTTANTTNKSLVFADMTSPGGFIGGGTVTVGSSSNGLSLTTVDATTKPQDLSGFGPVPNPKNTSSGQLVKVVPISGGTSPATPVPVAQVIKGATVGVAYSETISAQGGTSPYTFTLTSGTLPAGLSLNNTTGVISGTPTTAGTSTFSITATDSLSNVGVQQFQIVVAASSSSGGGAFVFLG